MTKITTNFADPAAGDETASSPTPTVSFEYFPPKSLAATDRLLAEIDKLDAVDPDFVSVTYGAGGTTRTRTSSIVCGLSAEKPYPVMPHLTAIGHSRKDVNEILDAYVTTGVDNVLVLAGDPPSNGSPSSGDFQFASELVDHVRGVGDFCVGVAAFPETHPRSVDRDTDRNHLAAKLSKADFGVTQFFFDAKVYSEMMTDLSVLGSTEPVLPGVMPIANTESIRRFAEMNGAAVPEELFARIEGADSETARHDIAVTQAAELVADLLAAGAPGIHFYTLNKAELVLDVIEAAGLR